jgi:hypothetical protein
MMLSWSDVVQRIKEELSLPFQMLEKNDEQIIDYCKRNALRKFTFYFPQKWRLTLNCADTAIQVPGRYSEFFLIDPDEREIKTITNFWPTIGEHLFNNHPFLGPWTNNELEQWHLNVYNSNLLAPFSNYNYMCEFIPPNQFRITPRYRGKCTVEYERTHDPELSTINPELQDDFIDLCQGMFFMMIGRLRQKYTTTQTPFGEIPLNGDLIYNDGKEMYDKVIEKFDRMTVPNVVFQSG